MSKSIPILIIDDKPANLFAYRQLFADEDYALDLCSSAAEALRHLVLHPYACILCEVPEVDGVELARILGDALRIREVPLLLVTSHEASQDLVESCLDCGAYDFLSKPVEPKLLKRKLRIFAGLYAQKQKVEQQRALFEAVLANTHEGVAVFDADGKLEYRNFIWDDLCGSSDAMGRAPLVELWGARAGAGDVELGERIVTVSLRALDGQFSAGRSLATVRDVTAERREERRVLARQQELEMFAHLASHDLRAPLRHLTAFTEVLRAQVKAPDPQVVSTLDTIQAAAARMRSMVDCLQRYAEAGQSLQSMREVNLQRLLVESWEILGTSSARLHVQGPLPVPIGDPGRISQVLQNLLQNALKFSSPERTPEIWVSGVSGPDGIIVSIRDNGIGIPLQHRHRIFQVFQRLHTRDQFEGDGIGLSICQRVMEQHGGKIEVRSDGLTGSTFLLHFPRRFYAGSLTGT